ncbi:MAG: YtxH domain-containing protein [Ktedonobacteraceae bacterium]|nr:YtxH domain-containing protein [Ktedonobacteraceae bacterium]
MNNFLKGLLIGMGIGLLIAPLRGEEMRRMLGERLQELQGYLPESEQIQAYRQQITDRVSQTANSLKGYAQQATSTVKSAASNLSGIAQNAASTVKSTGQDIADQTKDAAKDVTR